MLAKMIAIAAEAHKDQRDKAGEPYILHCLKVMHYLKNADEETKCIAVGHDLFEDTDISASLLTSEGFSGRVIAGIFAMTKQRGQSYAEYKAQVMSNLDAVPVKMADLRHNSDIRRLKGAAQKDFDRVVRYQQFYSELQKQVNKMEGKK